MSYFSVLFELKMSVHAFVVSCLIICIHVGQVSPIPNSAITPRPIQQASDHTTAVQNLIHSV